MPRRVRIAPLAAALTLIACGSGSASAPQSGIRGRALIGPTCPVERVPADPRCRAKPFATRIAVLRVGDRRRVGTARSGRDGRFAIRVRPGRYYLTGASHTRPFARTVLVSVHARRFTPITVTFDSGIR